MLSIVERISLDMADCTHFERKLSQNSARSLNWTKWKSALITTVTGTRSRKRSGMQRKFNVNGTRNQRVDTIVYMAQ